MIQRLQNKTFEIDKEVIECHGFTRLVLIELLVNMLDICMPEDFQWNYDFKDKGLARDDHYWRSLFLSSNNDDFDISNVWKLYSKKQNKDHGQTKSKLVHKEVDFSHSIGNPWTGDVDLSKIKCVQKSSRLEEVWFFQCFATQLLSMGNTGTLYRYYLCLLWNL